MMMMMMITSLMFILFTQVRLATILRELPFTISFSQRVLVFQNLISRDKQEHQGEMVSFMQGPHINLSIRRNYIYEDSYDKLSKSNEPNIKLKMRVQLVNAGRKIRMVCSKIFFNRFKYFFLSRPGRGGY